MKRRNFVVASGSIVMTAGISSSQFQEPAVAVDFEVSVPDKDPEQVDNLILNFKKLKITPNYIDENQSMTINCQAEVGGTVKESNSPAVDVVNGEIQDISDEIEPIRIDVNTQSVISGEITVNVDHPDIQETYVQNFNVTPENIEIFTESGISKTWNVPSSVDTVTVLAVGGGGAGAYPGHGGRGAGGGGAGGLVFVPNYDVSSDSQLNVYVGKGGNGAANDSNTYRNKDPVKYAGENTEFGDITALGGGSGGHAHYSGWSYNRGKFSISSSTGGQGIPGGSGGGADGVNDPDDAGPALQTQMDGVSGQYGFGNVGGKGRDQEPSGGGGGAGEAGKGVGDSVNDGGDGGDGLSEVTVDGQTYNFADIFGTQFGEESNGDVYFAGGGGASGHSDGGDNEGKGGLGGGGDGADSNKGPQDGQSNTGAGGGSGNQDQASKGAGDGGSGIVMIAY